MIALLFEILSLSERACFKFVGAQLKQLAATLGSACRDGIGASSCLNLKTKYLSLSFLRLAL